MVNICEEETIHEFAYTKSIHVKCMNCLKPIVNFAFVRSFSLQSWSISILNLMNNIVFDVNLWGEIHCECGKFLGYELNLSEWILFKRNVVLNH